jgi:hypothetical protein
MEKITSREQLTPGTEFYHICADQLTCYRMLCVHPDNSAYILAIEGLTKDAPKLYIPNLLNGDYYLGPYDSSFVEEKHLEYYQRCVSRATERIEEIKQKRKEQESRQPHIN